jgi:N-acetylmuramoyl-L-alanine amidase
MRRKNMNKNLSAMASVRPGVGPESFGRPASGKGWRLRAAAWLLLAGWGAAVAAEAGREQRPIPAAKPPARLQAASKRIPAHVVAIDAGHGGKDTGAIGPGGRFEKDIVLSIARRLAAFIRAEPGMTPAMVRRDDRFIPLPQRKAIARAAHADLLVSLHADADPSGRARGMSVYTVSGRGAGREAARWPARKDNAPVPAGGTRLGGKDATLARVLFDLSRRATPADGERAASNILREVRKSFPIHRHEVQKAGFVVLKAPDIPSVLVETGFISHPVGERQLADPVHQNKIARALFHGIRRYFANSGRTGPAVRIAAAGTPR